MKICYQHQGNTRGGGGGGESWVWWVVGWGSMYHANWSTTVFTDLSMRIRLSIHIWIAFKSSWLGCTLCDLTYLYCPPSPTPTSKSTGTNSIMWTFWNVNALLASIKTVNNEQCQINKLKPTSINIRSIDLQHVLCLRSFFSLKTPEVITQVMINEILSKWLQHKSLLFVLVWEMAKIELALLCLVL